MIKFSRNWFARLDAFMSRSTLPERMRALLLMWEIGVLLLLMGIYLYTAFSFVRQVKEERLDGEITLAQKRFAEFGDGLSTQARFIAQSGDLAQAVSGGDRDGAREAVVQRIRFFDIDNVDVLGLDGDSVVEIHRAFGVGHDAWMPLFQRAAQGETVLSLISVPAAEGTPPRHLLVAAAPLRDNDSAIMGVVAVGQSLDDERLGNLLFARPDVHAALYGDGVYWAGDAHSGEEERLSRILADTAYVRQAVETGIPVIRPLPLLPGLEPYISAYVPLSVGGESRLVLALAVDIQNLIATRRNTIIGFALLLVIGMAVLQYLLVGLVRHTVARPLQEMARVSEAFVGGQYDLTVSIHSSGDMQRMVESFNRMAATVSERDARLKEFNRTLEIQVAERTAELQRMETAVRAAANAVVITDTRGVIRWVNPAFERLTGYSAEEAIGETSRILRSGIQSDDFYRQMWETIEAGEVWRGELVNRRKDGSLYVEHMTIAPVRNEDGVITDYIAIKEDITEYRRLVDELQRARQEAEAANQAKSQFLANMSHEFRTPLTAIVGYSELLEEDILEKGYLTFLPDVRSIRQAGEHLASLIDAVLDLAKIEAGYMQLDIRSFPVDEILRSVIATMEPLFAKSGNRLEVSMPPDLGEMTADSTKTRQILINLLGNANKFTEQGIVTLRSRRFTDEKGKAWVEFQVQDTGIGMTEEQLERIFDEFVQADPSVTRAFGGTGLGLSVSKHFCEMMGGTIFAESEVGKGSTFTVRLPANVATSTKGKPDERKY